MATESRELPPLARLGVRPRVVDYIRSLWDRRHFVFEIPAARLSAQHRNTVLGGLWHVIDPLVSVFIWWVMFGVILNINRGVDNLVGFLAVGSFVFHFTTNATKAGGRSLTQNEGLIRAISFPRAVLPLAGVISELLQLGYAMFAMFTIVLITGEQPSWTWFAIVPIVAIQFVFNTGMALFFARVGARFRDVVQMLPYGLRVWGMLSGIFAPIGRKLGDHPFLLKITQLNPGYQFMHMSRRAILDNEIPHLRAWFIISMWAAVALVVGFFFFLGREQEYGRG